MGWSNYIVIDKLKLIVETHRDLEELEDYISNSLDKLIDEDNINDEDISKVEIRRLTVDNLRMLSNIYIAAENLFGLNIDNLLLFWLKNKNIEYNIKSEFNIDLEEYSGYTILRRKT